MLIGGGAAARLRHRRRGRGRSTMRSCCRRGYDIEFGQRRAIALPAAFPKCRYDHQREICLRRTSTPGSTAAPGSTAPGQPDLWRHLSPSAAKPPRRRQCSGSMRQNVNSLTRRRQSHHARERSAANADGSQTGLINVDSALDRGRRSRRRRRNARPDSIGADGFSRQRPESGIGTGGSAQVKSAPTRR